MTTDFEGTLAASLAWASVESVGPDLVRAVRWTWLVWSAGFDQVPPCLVHDLGFTLWRGPAVRFASPRRPDEERGRRLKVEDRLLTPWLLDSGARQAHVVLAGLAPELVDRAVAHAVALAVGSRAEGFPAGDLGQLRGVVERWSNTRDPEEIRGRAGAAFDPYGGLVDRIVERFGGQRLFSEADLWELSHLAEVPTESARLALRRMHQVAQQLGPPSPGTLLALRRQAREVPLEDPSSDVYPTGGFDGMATRGVLENIVRSEVVYLGEGVLDDSHIDLFDLRYLEGELLYYTRDESPLIEARRRLSVVVELAELRHKVRELSTQTVVLCLGSVLRMHADLVEGLGPSAVVTSLMLVGSDESMREEEASLVRLSLAAEIAHRRVDVRAGEALDVSSDPRRVVFSVRSRPSGALARAWIRVGERRFTVEECVVAGRKVSRSTVSMVDAADPVALRQLLDRLLLTT